jgi:hypothetical protein
MRRHELAMRLLRNLMVVTMLGIASAGAFAQRPGQGQGKRPDKEQLKVKTNDRKENPPPRNTNQPKPDNKKGRP